MKSIIEFAPFIIIGVYILFVFVLFLSSKFRFKLLESHKETSPYSWTRVMGTLLISSAIVIAFAQILGNSEPNLALITSMIAVAVGGKVVQKKNEKGESFFTISKDPKPLNENLKADEKTEQPIEQHPIEQEIVETRGCGECDGCHRGCERQYNQD